MKDIKIIASADFHFSRDSQKQALASLETIYKTAMDEQVDLVAIAGDLFDRSVQNTAVSGFPKLVDALLQILGVCPIVAVSGTPTHDIAGCYEVLKSIGGGHDFCLLQQGVRYLLTANNRILSAPEGCEPGARWSEDDKLLILGLPEPSKEWFLKDKQLGGAESTEAIKDGMRKLLLGLGAQRKEYSDIPCIFIYHGSVEGATMANGQLVPGREITIGRDDLALVGADYYALGHIHLAQQIGDLPAYYAGSAYPVNWGEQDLKACNLVTIEEEIS